MAEGPKEGKIEGQLPGLGKKIHEAVKRFTSGAPVQAVREAVIDASSHLQKLPEILRKKSKIKSGKERASEIPLHKRVENKVLEKIGYITDRKDKAVKMIEGYLGNYNVAKGEFDKGGTEGELNNIVKENKAVLLLAETNGKIGYGEFSTAMRAIIEAKAKMQAADGKFSTLNQSESFINLNKLNTQQKRVDWIINTFGLATGTEKGKKGETQRQRIITLWDEAYQAMNKPAENEQKRQNNWQQFMDGFNDKVGREEQIIIIGLLKMTQAQGIENFLRADSGKVTPFTDKSGGEIEAISLGGEHFRTVQTQYTEIIMAFVNSVPFTSGYLRWDQERGLLVPNISLAARAMIRDGTDFIPEDVLKQLEYVDNNSGDLLGYLLDRRAPRIKGQLNPWERLVAVAEFQTTYHDKFRGSKDLAQRMQDSRYEGAEFGDMANGDIIKNHWFERIPHFKEAVAKYTSLGADALQYDTLRGQAVLAKDKLLVQELDAAEVYAKQFLEMCGAPVGGISKDYMQTFQQIMDTTVSSRSGPLNERTAGEDGREFRVSIEKAIRDKNYTRTEVRVNEETGQQEIVLKINGAGKGVFTIPMKNAATLTLVGNGGQPLIDYLLANGFYKEAGYWGEAEKTLGPGFSVYARDWMEELGGLLTRTNIAYYEKREIGRRLAELYNGSERHKRVFIQFLLERKQQVGGAGWERSFEQENGVPFDSFNDVHIRLLAQKMGMENVYDEAPLPIETIVNNLANARDEKFWGNLFFDPLNENHLNKIYRTDKDGEQADLGFDRFYVKTWWGFNAISKLRKETLTFVEDLKVHGIKFEHGEWAGLTYEKLFELVADWQHCASTQERLETLGYLTQRLNEAQTEELMKLIRTPEHPITHQQLDTLFEHGLWRFAQLMPEEKDNILAAERAGGEIRVVGEVVEPLTTAEAKEGRTILGKAMEVKAKRMRLNIRATLDQALFIDLLRNPTLNLNAIYQKLLDQHMFEYCIPLLRGGDIGRISENPWIYPWLPVDDPNSYRLVEGSIRSNNPDPRFERTIDYILGALYVTSSMRTEDGFKLIAINSRDIPWNDHSQAGRSGLWLNRVKRLWGLNNIVSVSDQLRRIHETIQPQNLNWTVLDGEYAYLPDVVIQFAKEFYDVDLLNKEEVDKVGGDDFLQEFQEIIQDTNRLMFVMFGVRMTQHHLLPADYELFYKSTVSPLVVSVKYDDEIATPEWFQDIPPIRVPLRNLDGSIKTNKKGETLYRVINPVVEPWVVDRERQWKQIQAITDPIDWTIQPDGKLLLPNEIIAFVKDVYDVDISSIYNLKVFERDDFIAQLKNLIDNRSTLLFENISSIRIPLKDDKGVVKNDKVGNVIYRPDEYPPKGSRREKFLVGKLSKTETFSGVSYELAVKMLKKKWEREPVYGPWPYVILPHIEIDREAVREAAFLDADKKIGGQMVQIIDWMVELANLREGEAPSHTIETKLLPIIEKYALTFDPVVVAGATRTVLSSYNIRQNMPKVLEKFKTELTKSGASNKDGYNLTFINKFLVLMYGIDSGNAAVTKSLGGLREAVLKKSGQWDIYNYMEHLSVWTEDLRSTEIAVLKNQDNLQKMSEYYLYQLHDKLQFGVEGPSCLYRVAKIAQDRNWGYYKERILELRKNWLGLTSEAKKQFLDKFIELSDPETVKLAEEQGKAAVQKAYAELKKFGFKSSAEFGLFVGAAQTYGLKDLQTVLFSTSPMELAPYFKTENNTTKDAIFEANKLVNEERENKIWHTLSYMASPLGFHTIVGFFGGTLFQISSAKVLAREIEKSPFTPKLGSVAVTLSLGLGYTLLQAFQLAAQAPTLIEKLATIAQSISSPAAFLNFPVAALGVITYFGMGFLHDVFFVPWSFNRRVKSGKYAARKDQYYTEVLPRILG